MSNAKAVLGRVLTVVLIAALAAFLLVFFTNDGVFEWAFRRHQNTLSWVVRPLLILPFCFFAYRRSLNGMLATILAILTSMFWFPAPMEVDPRVAEFLAMERARLKAGFDLQNIAAIVFVAAFLVALAVAFWRRSLVWGGAVAVLGAVGKSAWSVLASPEGGSAVLPFAAAGVVALLVALVLASRFRKRSGRKD